MRTVAPLLLAALAVTAGRADAQLRIVTYNAADENGNGPRGGTAASPFGTVLQAIGTDARNGIARPADVLLLQESGGSASTAQGFVNLLNNVYGAGTYSRGSLDGATTGSGTLSIVYRTASVSLVGEATVGTTSASGAARQTLRYQLRPAGYDSSADFYVYNSHYKANDTQADATRRAVEASQIRANADALGSAPRVIYAGDFNLYRPNEAVTSGQSAYNTLTAAGNARATDPVFSGTSWTGNSFRTLHSQSPVVNSGQSYPGQVGGGMNDRFDFLLPSAAANSGRGVSLIGGSYRVFGNNGTHTLGGNISSGTGATAAVLAALEQASDHIPVVSDYQLPARMTAAAAGPARVIRGTTAAVALGVRNSAPVAAANGADVLDYTFAGTGAVTGSGSRAGLVANAAPQMDTLNVVTTAAGTYTGTVTATGTSPGVANGSFSQPVSVLALDPSNGSFSASTTATIAAADFGTATVGDTVNGSFAVFNLASANGPALTARLRFLSVTEATPGGPFTLALDQLTGDLVAGNGRGFTVTFASDTPGTFSDTFSFLVADEDVPGATGRTLTFSVTGTFSPVPEPAGVLALAAGVVVLVRRVRSTPRRG